MSMDQLMQAFQMFGKAAEEYGISSGIKDATEQVQALNTQNEMTLEQRYGAQKQLANQLQGRLAGLGASGQQIASAVGSVAPPDITTVEGSRMLAATAQTPADRMEANKLVASNQKAAGETNLAAKQPEMDARNGFEAAQRELDRQLQRDLAGAARSGKVTEAKAGEVSFTTNLSMAGDMINELKESVTRNGTSESDWWIGSNSKDAAVLKQTPYKLAITYAKIVDPDSVAREGEVAAAQKYLIELGAFKNKDAVLAQIDAMSTTINQYRANRGTALGKTLPGSPIPTKQTAKNNQALPPGVTPGSVFGTYKLKSGKVVQGYSADGGKTVQAEE